MTDKSSEAKGRYSAISLISNRLKLMGLLVLVVGPILAGLATTVKDDAKLVLVWLIGLTVPALVIGLIVAEVKASSKSLRDAERRRADLEREAERLKDELTKNQISLGKQEESLRSITGERDTLKRKLDDSEPTAIEHEVFISTPMAALTDEAIREHTGQINLLTEKLAKYCRIDERKIYYAGVKMYERGEFDPADIALRDTLTNIRKSKRILMIATGKVSSSIYIEIGMAIALGKRCILFVRKKEDLPFLLSLADPASLHDGVPAITTFVYDTIEDIINRLEKVGPRFD